MPVAFDVDLQMPFGILTHFHPFALKAEAFQIGVEPGGNVVAARAHEGGFLVGEAQVLEIYNLFFYKTCEAFGIDGVVAIDESVFHHGTRKAIYDGAAHRQFVEVGVGEMGYDRFHVVWRGIAVALPILERIEIWMASAP